jgi:hypothetical protein
MSHAIARTNKIEAQSVSLGPASSSETDARARQPEKSNMIALSDHVPGSSSNQPEQGGRGFTLGMSNSCKRNNPAPFHLGRDWRNLLAYMRAWMKCPTERKNGRLASAGRTGGSMC